MVSEELFLSILSARLLIFLIINGEPYIKVNNNSPCTFRKLRIDKPLLVSITC